jgi:hypothetical protein
VQLVLQAGVSLRGACRVMEVVNEVLGLALDVPHWTTGRLWLLRLGHATLTMAKEPAGDWAWLIDHSVQIGQEKCLVILGIRLVDLPPSGQCLAHRAVPGSRGHGVDRTDAGQKLDATAGR